MNPFIFIATLIACLDVPELIRRDSGGRYSRPKRTFAIRRGRRISSDTRRRSLKPLATFGKVLGFTCWFG